VGEGIERREKKRTKAGEERRREGKRTKVGVDGGGGKD
tara:strand:- start:111 stop:224 length:114 start_codon:yes stop_codon:yes gene_type:complete